MAKDWDYAKLTHEVSKAGGVTLYVDAIEKSAYNQGVIDTKIKMTPILLGALAVSPLITLGVQQIKKVITNKKLAQKQETERQREILINELNRIEIETENESCDIEGEKNEEI